MTETKHDSPQRARLSSGELFEYKGRTFHFYTNPDQSMGPPWEQEDGHGVITEWSADNEKRESLHVLNDRGGPAYFYDIEATLEVAKRDGWGPGTPEEAVQADYERMRGWCWDEWSYVGVIVMLIKYDDDATDGWFDTRHTASLWGIESDSEDYHTEVAYELADQILDDIEKEGPQDETRI
jgi:hypothetical protein